MSKTLADLRSAKPQSRPERSLTLCLRPDIVAEVMALTEHLDTLATTPPAPEPAEGEDRTGPPRRQVPPPEHPDAAGVREQISQKLAEMAEHEGELRVRATSDGDWRRWVDGNPPREEGTPGHSRDLEVAGGYCNADRLIESLATYAHSWDGEELTEGDWEILASNISGADLKQVAQSVVSMHESRLDFRQWRSALSVSLNRFADSASPAISPSAPDGSTGGSPSESSAATTATATA